MYLLRVLIGSLGNLCLLWLAGVITSVLVLRHSFENRSNVNTWEVCYRKVSEEICQGLATFGKKRRLSLSLVFSRTWHADTNIGSDCFIVLFVHASAVIWQSDNFGYGYTQPSTLAFSSHSHDLARNFVTSPDLIQWRHDISHQVE